MTTEVYATRAPEALRAADEQITKVVIATLWPLDINGDPTAWSSPAWQRAEKAAQILTDHVRRTHHIHTAAQAEQDMTP